MLVTGDGIKEWVAARLPNVKDFGYSETIGVVRNGRLIAGVIYNNFTNTNIELSIASISPRWATKEAIGGLLAYPFMQLGCKRITATTERNNKKVHKFLKRLGFMHEGTLHDALDSGDAYIFGMTKKYYLRSKWHNG